MEARQGRDAGGGSMRNAHDSATGHLLGAGDAQPSMPKKPQGQASTRKASWICCEWNLADSA